MIVLWMLHVLVVTALLGLAAVAAESLLRLWRMEARMVWSAATALSVMIPLVSLAQGAGLVPTLVPASTPPPIAVLLAPIAVEASGRRTDLMLALFWCAATAGLTFRFVAAAHGLSRRRRAWRPTVVDGEAVLVSRDAGPAVIGFARPTIVVPEWVLELDTPLRTLVLKHEREHRDRGDPRLLLGALAFTVAMPWNLALWYCLARLRGAMELDCDLRVLRAYPDTRRYGSLLLAVAQRTDRVGLLTAALTESNSLLGRRIMAMRSPIARRRLTLTLVLGAIATTLTIVACEVQAPEQPVTVAAAKRAPGPAVMPVDAVYFEYQVEQPVTPVQGSGAIRYPDLLRQAGVEGEVLVQFVVGPDGGADVGSLKVLRETHELFTQAVRNALPQMRFNPARVGGKAVRQLVQQPFTFSVSR